MPQAGRSWERLCPPRRGRAREDQAVVMVPRPWAHRCRRSRVGAEEVEDFSVEAIGGGVAGGATDAGQRDDRSIRDPVRIGSPPFRRLLVKGVQQQGGYVDSRK